MSKFINRIPGLRLSYQVYKARLRECLFGCSASLAILEALPGKLDIIRQVVFSI